MKQKVTEKRMLSNTVILTLGCGHDQLYHYAHIAEALKLAGAA